MDKADTYKKMAQDYLGRLRQQIDVSINDLKRLPKSVSQTGPLLVVRRIPICCNAILQSLGSPPGSADFNNAIRLSEKIGDFLLHTLHIADQILGDYFYNRKHKLAAE
jgi:hypothetical protein